MKYVMMGSLMVAAFLGSCSRSDGLASGSSRHGRFSGVGVYPAGQMWSQMVVADAAKDPSASRTGDDEQVIVLVDGETGEVRECGNLTGYCLGMQPFAKALATGQMAPVALARHSDQLQGESQQKAR